MSCSCGAQRMEECPTLAELIAEHEQLGADDGGWLGKAHRAMWCLLHPMRCDRDPKTGRPQLSVNDVLVIGAAAFAWWYWSRRD